MEQSKMIRQVNQIAAYFEFYPEQRAVESVRGHIQKFMAPTLRQQLLDYVADGGEGLHPLVLKAAEGLEVKSD